MIAERVGAGKAKRKAQGRHVHGRIPYGYVSAGEGRLEVDEAKAAVVRHIFASAIAGKGPGPIAHELNAAGEPGPTRKAWSRQAVTLLLRNPVYKGERYSVKGAQPAIISARRWNGVQAAEKARGGG